MNKNIQTLSLVLLLSSAALTIQADAIKTAVINKPVETALKTSGLNVGVVSATEIMMDTNIGKDASKAIDDKRQTYMKQIQADAQDIEKKEKDLMAKASTMSADSQRKQSLEIENAKKALELKNQNLMKDLQADAQTAMENLGKNFDKAVTQVAQATKADLIFEKESGRIVFAADHLNITNSVKTAMNNDYKATQVASAKKDKATA